MVEGSFSVPTIPKLSMVQDKFQCTDYVQFRFRIRVQIDLGFQFNLIKWR